MRESVRSVTTESTLVLWESKGCGLMKTVGSCKSLEEWRDIPGLCGMYQASNLGRIRSVDRVDSLGRKRFGKIINPTSKYKNGYMFFTSCVNGVRKNVYVHRAVLSSFDGEPSFSGAQVDHKNCDKTDNRLENLEWVTPIENIRRASDAGLLVNKSRSLTEDDVVAIRSDERKQKDIARDYGVCQTVISKIKRFEIYKDVKGGKTVINSKGRFNRGSLPEDVVISIRNDRRPAKKVAEEFGVDASCVYRIREGRSYKWVD